jgi:hypothetical protein
VANKEIVGVINMTTCRQHQTQTILYEQFVADSVVRAEYERYARLVCDLIGYEKFCEWCDAFIPDIGPWSEFLELVKALYIDLTQDQVIKEGQTRQDGFILRNEDPQ